MEIKEEDGEKRVKYEKKICLGGCLGGVQEEIGLNPGFWARNLTLKRLKSTFKHQKEIY